MKDFPHIYPKTQEDVFDLLRYIIKERPNDIKDFINLQNRFMAGRKVGKVPTGAADVAGTDRIGDFNYDYASGYYYLLVDNAGTAVWARMPLDTSW